MASARSANSPDSSFRSSPTLAPTVSRTDELPNPGNGHELAQTERTASDGEKGAHSDGETGAGSARIADEKPRRPAHDDEDDPTSVPVRLRTHESGFDGTGTPDDPFRVAFRPHDRDNPMAFKPLKRWSIIAITAMSTLAISFASSVRRTALVLELMGQAVTGALPGVIAEFGCSQEVATLSESISSRSD